MNVPDYAKVCQDSNAKPCIFAINATQQLNSDIAYSFRRALIEKRIELLIPHTEATSEFLETFPEYANAKSDGDTNKYFTFEKPFLDTQLLINETASLVYEKALQTGVIKISEQGNNRKDRYTSASYGNYFIDLLEIDLLQEAKPLAFVQMPPLISQISF